MYMRYWADIPQHQLVQVPWYSEGEDDVIIILCLEMRSGREERSKYTRHLQFLRVLWCGLYIAYTDVADRPLASGCYIPLGLYIVSSQQAGNPSETRMPMHRPSSQCQRLITREQMNATRWLHWVSKNRTILHECVVTITTMGVSWETSQCLILKRLHVNICLHRKEEEISVL